MMGLPMCFYISYSKLEMADAGVGVFVWRMNNCGILTLVYMGEGEGGLTFFFV